MVQIQQRLVPYLVKCNVITPSRTHKVKLLINLRPCVCAGSGGILPTAAPTLCLYFLKLSTLS